VGLLGSEEERMHRERQTRARRQALLEMARTEAHKKLYEGRFDLAIPAALQTLRFSTEVHGQNSIEVVPSYLLLGEASIGTLHPIRTWIRGSEDDAFTTVKRGCESRGGMDMASRTFDRRIRRGRDECEVRKPSESAPSAPVKMEE
jgi:hypothetical protein